MDSYTPDASIIPIHTLNRAEVQQWPRQTNFIDYKSSIEQGKRQYADTVLVPKKISEDLVFHLSCPRLGDALKLG